MWDSELDWWVRSGGGDGVLYCVYGLIVVEDEIYGVLDIVVFEVMVFCVIVKCVLIVVESVVVLGGGILVVFYI